MSAVVKLQLEFGMEMGSYGNVNGLLISAVKTDEFLTAAVVGNLLRRVMSNIQSTETVL